MRGCLQIFAAGIGIFLILGAIGGITTESRSGNPRGLAGAVVMLAIGIIIVYAAFRRKKRSAKPQIGVRTSLNIAPPDPVQLRIAELCKEATEKEKTNLDEAMRTLQEVERLERGIPMPPKVILDTRLRMATMLYKNGRFDEAEKLLLDELAAARGMALSSATTAAADQHYRERMSFLQSEQEFTGKAPKDWELRRSLSEWPDFERNIYCLAIYSKLRIFYTKARRPDRAFVFAMAEAYAGYENSTHNEYCDNPAPDFTTVEKLLRQLRSEENIPQWKAFLLEYTKPEPTCERCWEMIDAITASAKNANDQQVAGKQSSRAREL